MPATSCFKIPSIACKRQQLMNFLDLDKSNQEVFSSSKDNSNHAKSYQIIRLEKHRYSMIKYTKMVTNVTFK